MFVVVELANVVADRTQLSSPATRACATRSMAGRTSACECVNIRILVDSAMLGQKGGDRKVDVGPGAGGALLRQRPSRHCRGPKAGETPKHPGRSMLFVVGAGRKKLCCFVC